MNKIIVKIKNWLKKIKVRKLLIRDLIQRRDEVINRAKFAANRRFPEYLQEGRFPDLIEWIISPHIKKEWYPYRELNNKAVIDAKQTAYKILTKAPEIDKLLEENKVEL
ncbi:MAG: hypothetical protein ACFFAO_12490 [Candidatus Hermodarchaeota archaeon]